MAKLLDDNLTYVSFPINKFEEDADGNLVVTGTVTDGTVDSDRQVVDPKFSAKALAEWMDSGPNVRVMHSPSLYPAGRGLQVDLGDTAHQLKALVVEDTAKKLVRNKVLRAYSVGIANPVINRDPTGKAPGGVIVGGTLAEVSLVDRPANKNCQLVLAKSADRDVPWTYGDLAGLLAKAEKDTEPDDETDSDAAGGEAKEDEAVPDLTKSAYEQARAEWLGREPKLGAPTQGTEFLAKRAMWQVWSAEGDAEGLDGSAEGRALWASKRDMDPVVGGGVDRDKLADAWTGKNITTTSPDATGLVPYNLQGADPAPSVKAAKRCPKCGADHHADSKLRRCDQCGAKLPKADKRKDPSVSKTAPMPAGVKPAGPHREPDGSVEELEADAGMASDHDEDTTEDVPASVKGKKKPFPGAAAPFGSHGQASDDGDAEDEVDGGDDEDTEDEGDAEKSFDPDLIKVGPKGYEHGWIFVGAPGVGAVVHHPEHGKGTVTRAGKKTSSVSFESGHHAAFEHGGKGAGHFVERTGKRKPKTPGSHSDDRAMADVARDRLASGHRAEAASHQRAMEDHVLAGAARLRSDDNSLEARQLRETAGSIRDHRDAEAARAVRSSAKKPAAEPKHLRDVAREHGINAGYDSKFHPTLDRIHRDHAGDAKRTASALRRAAKQEAAARRALPSSGYERNRDIHRASEQSYRRLADVVAGTATKSFDMGGDYAVKRMHDAMCAAYHWDDVAAEYPALKSVADAVIPAWFEGQVRDAALKGDMPTVTALAARAQEASALPQVEVEKLADARALLHKSFSDMYPGEHVTPGAPPSPGQFQRPYISAGHAAMNASSGRPSSIPPATHVPDPNDFDRPLITAGHETDSPSNKGNNLDTPNVSSGASRTYYRNASRDAARNAMQAMHDHIATTFPDMCPMAASKSVMPPDMGDTNRPVPVRPAATRMAPGETSTKSVELGLSKKQVAKLVKAAVASETARLETTYQNQIAALRAEIDELGAQPDPAQAPLRGVVRKAAAITEPAPVAKRSLVAEAQARVAREQEDYVAHLQRLEKSGDPAIRQQATGLLEELLTKHT